MIRYKDKLVHTIVPKDVRKRFITLQGCPTCGCNGKTIWLQNLMGVVLPCDVGKRIYEVGHNVYQVENQEQLIARIRT